MIDRTTSEYMDICEELSRQLNEMTMAHNLLKLNADRGFEAKDAEISDLRAKLAPMREAAEPIIRKLRAHEDWLVRNYSKLGSDEETFHITAGEARALRYALRLAEGEKE